MIPKDIEMMIGTFGHCRGVGFNKKCDFFNGRMAQRLTRDYCRRCPVRSDCRRIIVEDVSVCGLWGGYYRANASTKLVDYLRRT